MRFIFCLLILAFTSQLCEAATALPYTARTRAYSGWNNTVLGDIPSIGMAGALYGLGNSWTGSQMNPSGVAMTLSSTSISITSNSFRDRHIQEYEQPVGIHTTGGVYAKYPWGFSLGFSNPHSEGAVYVNPADATPYIALSNIKGFQLSASRIFLNDKLSVGTLFSLNTANVSIREQNESAFSVQLGLGAMYKLENRILLGASYHFPTTYDIDTSRSSPIVSQFYQPLRSPGVFALGAGWIPNSSFRLGASFLMIGSTLDTALLSDNTQVTGANTTFQPRIGGAYEWLDIKSFSSRIFLGSYYEVPRVTGLSSRVHFTSGIEANAWIFTLGGGLDISSGYRNTFFSFGLDPIKVMRVLEIIPPESPRQYSGVLPNIRHYSDHELPRPLVENWDPNKERPQEDLLEIGKKIPEKIKKKMDQFFTKEEKKKSKKNKKITPQSETKTKKKE